MIPRRPSTPRDRKVAAPRRPDRCRRTSFARSETGGIAILTALAFPVLIGGVALGAEVGVWLMEKRKAQNAADVAAYSAVVELLRADTDAARARAEDVVHRSGLPAPDTSVDVSFPTPSRAEVVVTRTLPRYFTKLFLAEGPTVEQRAIAEVVQQAGAPACVLALDDSRWETGVEINGNAEIILPDCTLESHSRATESITMWGNPTIEAACIVTAGDIRPEGRKSSPNISLDCDEPETDASVGGVPPALAALPRLTDIGDIKPPVRGTWNLKNHPQYTKEGRRSGRLTPEPTGHPSGVPMLRFSDYTVLKGHITLDPGIYVIDGAELVTKRNTTLDGSSGVAFYLVNGGELEFHKKSTLNFRGLQGDFWTDVVLFDDGRRSDIEIEGGTWTGIMFTENTRVELGGGEEILGCFFFAADKFELNGNAEINLDCSDSDFDPGEYSDSGGGSGGAPGAPVIRIVE